MAAVPAMALAGSWQAAALFIILERTGKALRNPAANTMMSRAGEQIGQGWAFGLHEALDQTGALVGPLITALGARAAWTIHDGVPVARCARNRDRADRDRRGPAFSLGRKCGAKSQGRCEGQRPFAFLLALCGHRRSRCVRLRRLAADRLPLRAGKVVGAAVIPVLYAGAMGATGWAR